MKDWDTLKVILFLAGIIIGSQVFGFTQFLCGVSVDWNLPNLKKVIETQEVTRDLIELIIVSITCLTTLTGCHVSCEMCLISVLVIIW